MHFGETPVPDLDREVATRDHHGTWLIAGRLDDGYWSIIGSLECLDFPRHHRQRVAIGARERRRENELTVRGGLAPS